MNKMLVIPMLSILMIGFLLSAEKQQKIVIKKEIIGSDSVQHKIMMDHDIDIEFADSAKANVFVLKQEPVEAEVARIVIKKSGFFRKNKIIIDFDPWTKTILKIVDNDKDIDERKFHKYQEYLEDATELSELEALHPKMEELEYKLQMMELPDTGMMADLEELVVQLDGLESEHALLKKKHYASIIHVVELEKLAEIIQDIFVDAGQTPPQKIKKIRIDGDQFFLNGEEIQGELGKKCIKATMDQAQIDVTDKNADVWIDSGDTEVNVQISFD